MLPTGSESCYTSHHAELRQSPCVGFAQVLGLGLHFSFPCSCMQMVPVMHVMNVPAWPQRHTLGSAHFPALMRRGLGWKGDAF